jgi:hypothetical protein|tara:strand:+ start:2814 stop:2999 length:186 start_codon:yes stop_codon:yes gene_type:complete
MNKMINTWGLTLAVVIIILLGSLLYAGEGDYQEAVRSEAVYNQNVCNGVWPDYDNMKPDCE